MRIEPLFGNVLHRQMFSGLALLLPSNFRGFWLLGAAPINRRKSMKRGGTEESNVNSTLVRTP